METNNRTEQYLIDNLTQRYGTLMTVKHMAAYLERSEVGFRQYVRGNSEFAQKLRHARRKLGRRVYYVTCDVAMIIASEV